MNNVAGKDILAMLQKKGRRITPARRGIAETLKSATKPLTVQEIQARLEKRGISVHKTTVYRELETLYSADIITRITFGDGQGRYELIKDHHHHIICEKCNTVTDVYVPDGLHSIEKAVKKETGYDAVAHALEFFGLCQKCQ